MFGLWVVLPGAGGGTCSHPRSWWPQLVVSLVAALVAEKDSLANEVILMEEYSRICYKQKSSSTASLAGQTLTTRLLQARLLHSHKYAALTSGVSRLHGF